MPKLLKQKTNIKKSQIGQVLQNMKNFNQKIILVGLFVFLSLGFAVKTQGADGKIIVNATAVRVRSAPNLNGKILGSTKLGTVYPVLGKRGDWYNITFNEGLSGWISGTLVEPFDEARRGFIYQSLANKYMNRPKLEFGDASELFDFLSNIQNEVAGTNAEPDLALKRLMALAAALDAIPGEKSDQKIYKDFAQANEGEIVYSDPAGQYFVIAEKYWDLREKYLTNPIAEDIAWKASQTSLPGECEGYVPCHLYNTRETDGKYLELYPNGKHSKEALESLVEYLGYLANDAEKNDEQTGYYITNDPEDRANLEKSVSELRQIVSKSSNSLKTKILGYLDKIESGYQPKALDEGGLDEFWAKFKSAVIKKDKNAVAEMTKFPLAMPFGQLSIRTKAELLKRYDQVFNGETDAAKCFASAQLTKENGRYGIYCGFKSALDDETNKPIYYYFEKNDSVWKFVGLDNINE
jgi:hypothetical protein